ncbi:hypothetical protein [Streptomyces sp. NRRL S-495]|uniref:hypothetical protein n=1 Tax=Streptomyces sp. NRRL S-495 TaxID=1609133 RepID=UPI000AC2520F|nr:hypothetical protein [Streptomyces sp. NRRL S-495]
MPDDELDLLHAKLEQTRTELDTARRELGDLRAWLCKELGIIHRSPGPEGLTVLSVVSDKEIVAAVVQLRAEVDALKQPSDGTDPRWSQIDYLILEGRRIQALQKIRDEFGGGIHDALELLNHRFLRLREDRPEDFTASKHEPKEH